MRLITSTLAIASIALALTACTGKSSSSDQSNASASANAEVTAAASDQTAMNGEASPAPGSASFSGNVPEYPGATTRASTKPGSEMMTNASGKVLVTKDSFDKVYAWYQKNMPAGSERLHVTTPVPSAVFVVTDPAKGQYSAALAVSKGMTVITIAHIVNKTK